MKSEMFSVDFSFIDDSRLRELIEQYHSESISAYENNLFASALFLAGAVLEGALTWALVKGDEYQEEDLYSWGLATLINQAVKVNLIGKTAKSASWAVKDFRNFIHPGNAIRQGSSRPDAGLASGALAAVKEITRSLRGRLYADRPVTNEVNLSTEIQEISINEIMRSLNFAWLISGEIGGCRGPRTENDLKSLTTIGVQALVRLVETSEIKLSSDQVRKAGIEDHHEPLKDFTAPTIEQIEIVMNFINSSIRNNKPVAISCGAGYGRTSTFLACYLIHKGKTSIEALEEVERACDRKPETSEQLEAIRNYKITYTKDSDH